VGVKKDDVKAVEWYRKSAEQGDMGAQRGLGHMYTSGRGVPQDDVKSAEWYERAANQGDQKSQ
jgi:TPR repeat protein